MAISSSIYDKLQAPDIMGAVKEGRQMRDMVNQRKQKQAFQDALKNNLVTDEAGNQSLNQSGFLSALANSGNAEKYFDYQKNFKAEKQADQKAKQERMNQQIDFWGRAAHGIKDDQTYQMFRNEASQRGWDTSAFPEAYSPEAQKMIDFHAGLALTKKDQLAQANADRTFDLQKTTADRNYNLQKEDLGIKREKARRAANTPNFGKAPQGYRFKADGSLEPIPGSPQAEAKQNAKQKAKQDAKLVVQDIGRALDLLDKSPSAVGPYDLGVSSYISGTPSSQMEDLLASIKANIGFNKLQAMRQASPTGGALGSVSEKENEMLQATAGKLNTSMTEDMFKENLKRLYNQYQDVVHGPGQGPPRYALSFDESGKKLPQKMVKMTSPSGRVISVPANDVGRAKALGAQSISPEAARAELEKRRKAKQASIKTGGRGGS